MEEGGTKYSRAIPDKNWLDRSPAFHVLDGLRKVSVLVLLDNLLQRQIPAIELLDQVWQGLYQILARITASAHSGQSYLCRVSVSLSTPEEPFPHV